MSRPTVAPAQLDRDETRVLAECESEALIYRSIPAGVLTFLATQYAMSINLLSTRAKWAKLGASVFAGYFIGKLSYASTCQRKILSEIPHSHLARVIRGGEVQSMPTVDDHPDQIRLTEDARQTAVLVPESVGSETLTEPVGVNQYGDPIYRTAR